MKFKQKVILVLLTLIVCIEVAVCGYAIMFTSDAKETVSRITEQIKRDTSKRKNAVSIQDNEPFSILLMGVDTGDLGRTEQGRSDTMMVVTINPKKKQSTIVSLDRDIYTKISGYDDDSGEAYYDKLNHAYAYGGTKMAIESAQDLLDIPIDHYMTINMKGLNDLVKAIGGIKVNNKIEFTLDGIHVPKGKITLTEKNVLAYARMRDEDPEGDVGRQRRQREVLTKIVKKLASLDSVTSYKRILKAVEKNTKTDLTWNEMLALAENYRPALEKLEKKQLNGEGVYMNNTYYQILGINNLLELQNLLKKQLGLDTADSLPNLDSNDMNKLFFDDEGQEINAGTHDYYGPDENGIITITGEYSGEVPSSYAEEGYYGN